MGETSTIATLQEQGASVDETFQLLADETRITILQALWEAFDPLEPTPLSFSDIHAAVPVDDPGRLNYHLGELTTQFIRRTDDGYELREAGKRVMRVVLAGVAVDTLTIPPTEIEVACLFCGEPTEISYEDGQLSHRCTQCSSRCVAGYPPGLLSREELPPAGVLTRHPGEVYPSNRVWAKYREQTVMDGVCPECAGAMPVDSIRTCTNHQPDPTADEVCASCGSVFWGVVHHVCEVCKFHMQIPTSHYPPNHPAVQAFYYDHGIEFDLADHEQLAHLLEYRQEAVSDDPLRIETTIPLEGDELIVTFDDEMTIIDITE